MAELGLDNGETQDILGCLADALAVFEENGLVVTSQLVDAVTPALSWLELFCLRPEAELLRDPIDNQQAHKRISLIALYHRQHYENEGSDYEYLIAKIYRVARRVQEGKMCLRIDLERLYIFIENFWLLLIGLIVDIEEAEEEMPLLEMGVQLERAQRLLLDSDQEESQLQTEAEKPDGLIGEAIEDMVWAKGVGPDFHAIIYIDELRKHDIRRYSIFTPAPVKPNTLGTNYDENGFPREFDPVANAITDEICGMNGVKSVAFVAGAIAVVLLPGSDWHRDLIEVKILACIMSNIGYDCYTIHEDEEMQPEEPEDYEGVS